MHRLSAVWSPRRRSVFRAGVDAPIADPLRLSLRAVFPLAPMPLTTATHRRDSARAIPAGADAPAANWPRDIPPLCFRRRGCPPLPRTTSCRCRALYSRRRGCAHHANPRLQRSGSSARAWTALYDRSPTRAGSRFFCARTDRAFHGSERASLARFCSRVRGAWDETACNACVCTAHARTARGGVRHPGRGIGGGCFVVTLR